MHKNSLNYVYDMYLTLNTFNALRMNKTDKSLTCFHFKNFVSYMVQNFYIIAKAKNFKIEENIPNINDEIYAIYDYCRVIFFNVIMFILNNSKGNREERILSIGVKQVKFADNAGSFYQATIRFMDQNPVISYSVIADMLKSLNNFELRNIDIDKFNMLDIGLILSFYIVNVIYSREFVIKTNASMHEISFDFYASGVKNANNEISTGTPTSSCRILTSKIFRKPLSIFEKAYYDKIIDKIYNNKKNKYYVHNKFTNNRCSLTNNKTGQLSKKISFPSDYPYDDGNDDSCKYIF
jgi:hypothetical protein